MNNSRQKAGSKYGLQWGICQASLVLPFDIFQEPKSNGGRDDQKEKKRNHSPFTQDSERKIMWVSREYELTVAGIPGWART